MMPPSTYSTLLDLASFPDLLFFQWDLLRYSALPCHLLLPVCPVLPPVSVLQVFLVHRQVCHSRPLQASEDHPLGTSMAFVYVVFCLFTCFSCFLPLTIIEQRPSQGILHKGNYFLLSVRERTFCVEMTSVTKGW